MTGTSLIESPHGVNVAHRREVATLVSCRLGDGIETSKQSIADRLGLERVDVKAVLGKKDRETERAEKSMKWFYRSIIAGGIFGVGATIAHFTEFDYSVQILNGSPIPIGIMATISARYSKKKVIACVSRVIGAVSAGSSAIFLTKTFFEQNQNNLRHEDLVKGLISLSCLAVAIVMTEISHRKRMFDSETGKAQ